MSDRHLETVNRYGLRHFSPSSLNLWRAAPRVWCWRYLAKQWDAPSPAMARGTAVEAALERMLHGEDVYSAKEVAQHTFLEELKGDITNTRNEETTINRMIDVLETWVPPGELAMSQGTVTHLFDGINIPVVGRFDFAFYTADDRKVDIDLKTTGRMPSEPKPAHVRQVALYRKARNRPGGLLYVTEKKWQYYDVGDDVVDEALDELRDAALSCLNYLEKCADARDALRSLPIDTDTFYADADTAKAIRSYIDEA